MTIAGLSASAITDTTLSVLVTFNSPDTPTNYSSITINCVETGETSWNLNQVYDSTHTYWSRPYQFQGLTPGTSYTFIAYANGTQQASRSISTSGTKPTAPTDAVSVIHYSSDGTTINMQVQNAYGATSIDWSTPFGNWTRPVQSVPYIETFSAPEYGTEYIIGAYGWNSVGYAPAKKLAYSMTDPWVPSLSSGGAANNIITVKVNMRGGWDSFDVEMWTIDATSKLASKTQTNDGNTSFTFTFGNLVANASYLFRGISRKAASYAGGYNPDSGYSGWLTVKNDTTRPQNWTWTSGANSSGQKIQGGSFRMYATEWNDFCVRINDFRKFKGLSVYNFTTAQPSATFYYYMMNEAKTAIDAMNSTGVSSKASGNKVLASDFNALMNALNGIT